MGVMWWTSSFILFAVRRISEQRCAGESWNSTHQHTCASYFCQDFGYDQMKGAVQFIQMVQIVVQIKRFRSSSRSVEVHHCHADRSVGFHATSCATDAPFPSLFLGPTFDLTCQSSVPVKSDKQIVKQRWSMTMIATTAGWLASGSRSRCVFISRLVVRLASAICWKM